MILKVSTVLKKGCSYIAKVKDTLKTISCSHFGGQTLMASHTSGKGWFVKVWTKRTIFVWRGREHSGQYVLSTHYSISVYYLIADVTHECYLKAMVPSPIKQNKLWFVQKSFTSHSHQDQQTCRLGNGTIKFLHFKLLQDQGVYRYQQKLKIPVLGWH
jgi:hypothetical protein